MPSHTPNDHITPLQIARACLRSGRSSPTAMAQLNEAHPLPATALDIIRLKLQQKPQPRLRCQRLTKLRLEAAAHIAQLYLEGHADARQPSSAAQPSNSPCPQHSSTRPTGALQHDLCGMAIPIPRTEWPEMLENGSLPPGPPPDRGGGNGTLRTGRGRSLSPSITTTSSSTGAQNACYTGRQRTTARLSVILPSQPS